MRARGIGYKIQNRERIGKEVPYEKNCSFASYLSKFLFRLDASFQKDVN